MKKSTLFISFLFLSVFTNAQQNTITVQLAKNSFFVEFGGNAIQSGQSWTGYGWWKRYSINYDRIIYNQDLLKITVRIGSNFPFKKESHNIPLMLNLLLGRKNLFFELGLGGELIFFNADYHRPHGAATAVIGMRYQNYKNGIMGKIGITPTVGSDDGSSLYVGSIAGISIGYSF